MVTSHKALEANARDLELDFAWFAQVVDACFKRYFGTAVGGEATAANPPPPLLTGATSAYARLLRQHKATEAERLALLLALLPHCKPQMLDIFHTRNTTFERQFTEFGGKRDAAGDFSPTGQTLAFLIAGAALAPRFAIAHLFVNHFVLLSFFKNPCSNQLPVAHVRFFNIISRVNAVKLSHHPVKDVIIVLRLAHFKRSHHTNIN